MGLTRLLLLIGFFVILTVVGLELARHSRFATLVDTRQFRMRISMAVLFLILITMILAGTYVLEGVHALLQLLYWTGCLILSIVILVIAALDVRDVMVNYLREKRNILREDILRKKDE